MSPSKLAPAIAIALLGSSATAAASQLDYDLYAGIMHSDNINLSTSKPISQTVFAPGVNFTWDQQGSAFQAHAFGNVQYLDYLGSRFRNQTAVQLSSQALWTLAPERLDIAFSDYAGMQPLDTRASDAPGNRQRTNVFTVGPVFHFRLGPTLRGQAELRYINSYAEKTSQFNSNREQAALRLQKDLSATDHISLNADYQHVDLYRDKVDPNYDRRELFAHYLRELQHFTFDAQLGTTRIDFDRAGVRSISSPLVRASLDWRPSTRNTFTLTARRQYSDAAQDMMLTPGAQAIGPTYAINTGDTMANPQVYLERMGEASWAFRGERFSTSVTPYYRKLGYSGSTEFDQTGRGINATMTYRLSPTLSASVYAARENLKFNDSNRLDKTLLSGVMLTSERNQHWSWRTGVSYQRRHSSVVGQGYHETEIYVGVVYKR